MFYGEQKKKKCIGTYRVSGYTREDGTKVSSYMRTCGAKHEGKDTAEKTKEEQTLTDDLQGNNTNISDNILYGGVTANAQEFIIKNIYAFISNSVKGMNNEILSYLKYYL